MYLRKQYILCVLICLTVFSFPTFIETASARDFIVVIDPGHGGRDPGALGKTAKEKDINLKVALKLGKLIENNCPDVKVIYTRRKDVFVALNKRAEIANNAKADLFISIHTNSIDKPKSLKGASTWTLGLARSASNLEVAKRENAVILYEDDYETRYAGFDPNSSESYIIFEFMQDKYMAQSVHLADLIQKQFKNECKRVDYGVHQAGFLVLRATVMPSVLIELGFISNAEEERYLSTESGTTTMANGIYRAFLQYKREIDLQQGKTSLPPVESVQPSTLPEPAAVASSAKNNTPAKTSEKVNVNVLFKIQIFASTSLFKEGHKQFKGLKNVDYYKEGDFYKYTYGSTSNYNEALRIKKQLAPKFKDAFVVAFKNGKKIDINIAIDEFNKNRNR